MNTTTDFSSPTATTPTVATSANSAAANPALAVAADAADAADGADGADRVEPDAASNSSPSRPLDLSIVVPAMNEQESLATLHRRVIDVCQAAGRRVEIIFVDDGSSDSTWDVMRSLTIDTANDATGNDAGDETGGSAKSERSEPASATCHRTLAIRLRRNFGKAAALSAGFAAATGEVVITMDADLQDDPDEIPRFLEALDQGKDVISGWKRVRHDPWHKVLPSRVFNAMVSGLTGVRLHDHNCGFKAYRREVLGEVDLYGERHRFIPVLAAARGWRVGEIEVQHHPRVHGQSKYGLSRLGKGFLDLMSIYLLTGYGRRPLHLIGSAGLVCFAAGAVGMFYLSVMWVWTRVAQVDPIHLHQKAVFYYCILAVLLGAQCVLAGLIAELIVSVSAARDRLLQSVTSNPADGIASPIGRSAANGSSAAGSPVPVSRGSYNVLDHAGFVPRDPG